MEWLVPLIVVVLVLVALGVYLWVTYTSLRALNGRVDEAWRDIDGHLARRAELVPTVLEAVRGVAPQEKRAFDGLARAREESLAARGPAEASVAEDGMQKALASVFSVAEGYPQLQTSKDFLQLQGELVETQEQVQASRRFYNGGVRELNSRVKVFPNTLFVRRLGFSERPFFEVDSIAAISEPPRVQF